jgi:hypothetical protein
MMALQAPVAIICGVAGTVAAGVAIGHERRMQRHRLPGVGYAEVTLRPDGGWQRADLFSPEGLALQRQAARAGVTAAAFWLAALAGWILLGGRG